MKRNAMWCALLLCGASVTAQAQTLPGLNLGSTVGPMIGGGIQAGQAAVAGLVQTGLNGYLLPAQATYVSPLLEDVLVPGGQAVLANFPEVQGSLFVPVQLATQLGGAAAPLLLAVPKLPPLPGLP
ncbi:MAG: hypothetical protein V4650_00460 [Pseudomonadota bacterium]